MNPVIFGKDSVRERQVRTSADPATGRAAPTAAPTREA